MAKVDSGAQQIGGPNRRWDKVIQFTVLNDTIEKKTLDLAYRRELPWTEPWLYDEPAFVCSTIPYIVNLETGSASKFSIF